MVRFAPGSPNPPFNSKSLPPIHIFTIQGHPEFTESIITAVVEQRAASGVIDAEAAAGAEKRRFMKTDGVDVVGKTIWDIMLEAK